MTISNDLSAVRYQGNGSTVDFPYTFLIPKAEDLTVSLYDSETNELTTLTEADYNVTGIGTEGGGTLTYPYDSEGGTVVPLPATKFITLERNVDYVQETSISNQGGFHPEVLEEQLDQIVMMAQQNRRDIDRSIKAPVGSAGGQFLPGAAGTVPVFDEEGNLSEGPDASEIADAAANASDAVAAKTAAETAQGLAEGARDSAQGYASAASGSASAASGSASAASSSAGIASQAKDDALQAQSDAESARDLASGYASSASGSAGAASNSASDALGYANAASGSANAAANAKTDAETAKGLAEDARDKAELWADEDEDVPVELGKYSAKHWAAKASVAVTATHISYDNTTAELPGAPSNVQEAVDALANERALRGYLYGLTLANNATDATNDIDVAPGQAASTAADPILMRLAAAMTKRNDAPWQAGDGEGGWLDGAFMQDGLGHCHLMSSPDGVQVDVGLSPNVDPTADEYWPEGWVYRRIGSVRRQNGVILPFVQSGDLFQFRAPTTDYTQSNPGVDAFPVALPVPTGIKVTAIVNALLRNSTPTPGAYAGYLSDLDTDDLAPALAGSPLSNFGTGGVDERSGSQVHVTTNTSGQIRARMLVSTSDTTFYLSTIGWIDTRGRL